MIHTDHSIFAYAPFPGEINDLNNRAITIETAIPNTINGNQSTRPPTASILSFRTASTVASVFNSMNLARTTNPTARITQDKTKY